MDLGGVVLDGMDAGTAATVMGVASGELAMGSSSAVVKGVAGRPNKSGEAALIKNLQKMVSSG
jgi:hypothetical protein